MSEIHQVKITLLGKEHTIKSPVDPETTQRYAAYIDGLMKEVSSKLGSMETGKVAALAMLQITHELYTLRKRLENDEMEYKRRITELTENAQSIMSGSGIQTKILPD